MIGLLSSVLAYLFGSQPLPKGFNRALGTAEHLFNDVNQRGMLIISSIVFISSTKRFSESNIAWALKRLMKIHPLLRMRVVPYNRKLYWAEMDILEPDLRVVYSGDWQSVFSENTCEIFDHENGPLWRVTVMPNAESNYRDTNYQHHTAFVMSFSHAIIDGQGRMKLLNDFQDLLAESLDCDNEDKTELDMQLPEVKSLKISPSFDAFMEERLGLFDQILLYLINRSFIKRFIVGRLINAINKPHPFQQCVGEVAENDPAIERTTSVYPMVLNVDDTALVLKACKMHKVSVHSALQAASVIAISEIILDGAKERGIATEDIAKSTVGSTAGLQNELKSSSFNDASYVGSLIYGITSHVIIPECAKPMKFWKMAEQNMKTLHSNKEANMKFVLFAQSLMLGNADRMPQKRFNLLSYTNLGNCNYLNRNLGSKVKVTAHYSGTGEHHSGPVFANCITTLDNKMFWGALHYSNVTSRELAARYLRRSISLLLENCRQTVEEKI